MTQLLDTHVVRRWLADDPTLPVDLIERLDHDPHVYVSAASVWEVAIKQAVGKLDGPPDLPERVRDSGFVPLPIESDHAITAAKLPLIHRDPFDWILIAQAQHEGLMLVTRDQSCAKYDVAIVSA